MKLDTIMGFGTTIIFAVIAIGIFVIFIILILAINQLHKLPQMQITLENIEKLLRYHVKLHKQQLGIKDDKPEEKPAEESSPA